jgi:autotransporter-associated beta strand protein
MKKTTRLAAALFAALTLATQIPASAEPTNYTILDSYTGGVPTGTSYQELEYYNQYVDAGSVDASPFVIDKTTANSGGILFYGSTELISAANANTFRLTSTTGAFDFTSFNLQDLETNDAYASNTIPTLTITSSAGATQTWSASALPPPPPINYTILDSYNGNGVPTGTSYQELEYYNQYVDAFSVDHSPFVLTKTTANSGGILFYYSTELISGADANTFRLTSTTGAFDFTSFNLQDLEGNDAYASNEIPTLTITSSLGQSQTWSSTYEEFFPGSGWFSFDDSGVKTMDWSGVDWVEFTTQYTKAKTSEFALTAASDSGPVFYSFDDSGVKTMNWSGVDWVDLTTQYTKAKTSEFVLTSGARPLGSFGDLAIGTTAVTAPNSTVAEVSGTATVNVDSTGTTIDNVAGGTVNVNGASTTIQSYNGGNVDVDRGLIVAMNDGNSSGVISGGGGMTKNSVGTLTLGGVNTYTGATTVGGGLLVVNGSIASSPVSIQTGGTLGGSGTVGAVTVQSGGTINPGNSPGTLNINGNVDWLGGGNYNWQIVGVTGTAGTVSTWDLISATGILDLSALSIGSKFNINLWSLQSTGPDVNGALTGFNNTQSYTWKIATAAGGITGFNSSYFNLNTGAINGTGGFANGLGGGSFSVAQSGNDLNLVFTAAAAPGAPVPEPGTWAAAALLVGGAAFMRWRKRAKVA